MEISIIFPHQLHQNNQALSIQRPVYLIEDGLFFTQFAFHKQKIFLHRASMKYKQRALEKQGYSTIYIDALQYNPDLFFQTIAKQGVTTIYIQEPDDFLLKKRISKQAEAVKIALEWTFNPGFMYAQADVDSLLHSKKRRLLFDFYVETRKKWKILLDQTEKPLGGQWTFDEENRKKIPQGTILPTVYVPKIDEEIRKEALNYVNQNFSHHYGELSEEFLYPISPEEAKKSFLHFLRNAFREFGPYQDAIINYQPYLFHSLLSASLNIGLIQPLECVKMLIEYSEFHSIPIASTEGFIRQLIGWREFVRGVYHDVGTKERNSNYFNHTFPIPNSIWNGNTGIEPIDQSIQLLKKYAYNHHIERLMILGNFMLLCEIHPTHVYEWFMTWYIDAYDWVMVPNVYGMSQFADGGLMSTKPYVSGSNYVIKMSNYPKGDWCTIWDGLYWRFLWKNKPLLEKNQRMSMMYKLLNQMSDQKREMHIGIAENFLKKLHGI